MDYLFICTIVTMELQNGIWSHHIMANRWGNNGNSDGLFLVEGGSKISADSDCSHEIKRCLLLGRKVMSNLHSILKSRDIILPTKVHIVTAMVFPVVMYGCESWTIKKAERQRIDAFELWCWRRLLRIPWIARRSNQSVLNIHWKDWCWRWNPSTLAIWCEELTHLKRPWCCNDWRREEKGMTEDEMVGWHHQLDGCEFE